MSKLAVDQLGEGMVVDDTVTDLHGTVLLPKGTVITHHGIKLLKMWGILEVSVDEASAAEHPATSEPAIDPRFVEEAKVDIAMLFQHTDRDNVFVKELMRLATHRIARTRSGRG